jgi:hypothetical protein
MNRPTKWLLTLVALAVVGGGITFWLRRPEPESASPGSAGSEESRPAKPGAPEVKLPPPPTAAELAANPDYAPLKERMDRLAMMAGYGPTLRTLDVPKDKLDKLKELLVAQMKAAAAADGSEEKAAGDIRALLGNGRYHQFLHLQRQVTMARFLNKRLGPAFEDAEVPLRDEQADALAWDGVDAENALGHPAGPYPTSEKTAWALLLMVPMEKVAETLPDRQLTVFKNFRNKYGTPESVEKMIPAGADGRLDRLAGLVAKYEGAAMDDAGAPLSSMQVNALARMELPYDPAGSGYRAAASQPANAETGLRPMDDEVLAKATRVLTDQQMDVLKQNRIWQARLYALTRRPLS